MCLTGVDYFSTLGYQPAIAALAAGVLAPIATVVLVIVTLAGALPVYRRVAEESPRGSGSIAMLAALLPRWGGKLVMLALLGFAATDFMITMTLSAADATAHLVENPFAPAALKGQEVAITLVFLALLGAVFLRGFREAIGIATAIVGVFLALNIVVVSVALAHVFTTPLVVDNWWVALTTQHGDPLLIIALALLVFPKLALGLSGFETGVAVMPQIRGGANDTIDNPAGRIRGAKRLPTSRTNSWARDSARFTTSRPSRSCGSRAPRRWRACSTSCLASCRASEWRPRGHGPSARSRSCSWPSRSSSRSSSKQT